jgi:hypothetical protein
MTTLMDPLEIEFRTDQLEIYFERIRLNPLEI